jgi:hypothetical protein
VTCLSASAEHRWALPSTCSHRLPRLLVQTHPLVWLLQEVLGAIAAAAQQVEAAFDGQPQDIEGVWVDGKLTVVQSRPQVL